MPAETYVEPHWFTGKLKTRCRDCGKVVYPDEATATFRAQQISEREPMYPYLGRCGHWHVSRRAPKKVPV
jgi:hypothetical protein